MFSWNSTHRACFLRTGRWSEDCSILAVDSGARITGRQVGGDYWVTVMRIVRCTQRVTYTSSRITRLGEWFGVVVSITFGVTVTIVCLADCVDNPAVEGIGSRCIRRCLSLLWCLAIREAEPGLLAVVSVQPEGRFGANGTALLVGST